MKFKNLKKKLFKYNYDGEPYDYNYDDLSVNSNYSRQSYPQTTNPDNNKKKKNKNILWMSIAAVSSVAGACLIGYAVYSITNSSVQNSSNGGNNSGGNSNFPGNNKSDFTVSSPASYWISQRTLSLRFIFSTGNQSGEFIQSGTGWIYQANKNSNTFFIATNLHVSNIVSFNNKNVTSFEDNRYSSNTYTLKESYVGLDFNVNSTNNDFSNDVYYFQTSIPEIIYSTTTDDDFNNTFNNSNQKYYGLGKNNNKQNFPGAVDMTILKYVISPNEQSTTVFSNKNQKNITDLTNKHNYIDKFKTWLYGYFDNPTKIYKESVDGIKNQLLESNLYMGGFPNKSDINLDAQSTENISWLSFSNFKISTKAFQEGFYSSADFYIEDSYENNIPIAFYPSNNETDYTKYNYLSIGYLSCIEADSYSGASGSPIVVQRNGEFEIIGIYWGSIGFTDSTNSQNYVFGAMNWFATNSYELATSSGQSKTASYNLTTKIDQKINTILDQ